MVTKLKPELLDTLHVVRFARLAELATVRASIVVPKCELADATPRADAPSTEKKVCKPLRLPNMFIQINVFMV